MTRPNPYPIRRLVAAILLASLGLSACGGADSSPKIGIVSTLRSLDPIVEAFQSTLLNELDSNVEFVFLDPQAASFESGMDQLLAANPDLIMTLTTPASLEVGALIEDTGIPQVFGMVTDPINSNLVGDSANPGHNRTGVGLFHIQHTLALAVKATGAHRIGVLNNPADPASVTGLDLTTEAAKGLGVEVIVMTVDDDRDLDRVLINAPSLNLDLFFIVGSPFAVRNLGNISLVTRTWSIPTASALTVDRLPEGFMIGVAPSSADLGDQMAQRALAILNGAPAGTIPIGVSENVALLDLRLARRYGITVPDEVLVAFDSVIGGT